MSTERERVLPLQVAFKDPVIREVARRIAARGLHAGAIWPDEILIDDLHITDRNCVGSAYHWLRLAGIIAQDFAARRTSKAVGANGRAIFAWKLLDRHLAEVFLERSAGGTPADATGTVALHEQREMTLA